MSLDELRGRIDALDKKILECLNERATLALDIGKIKQSENAVVYVPEREKQIFDDLRALNQGPLPDSAIKVIYREVISAVRELQRPVDIAFLGPKNTFSHIAAERIFGDHATYRPEPTIDDVFTEVERKRADYGLVPVETSMGGGVSDTLDRFVNSDLKIINEVMLHISQNLMANCAQESIKRIYSKVQPFEQCRRWLKANMPNVELVEVSSTAKAAELAAKEENAAAVASSKAAESYGLDILVPGIEDAAHNFTRFFVIGRQLSKPTGNDKTSVMCAVKDRPGALYELLIPFSEAGVSLTRIESRPSQRKAWEYVFFMDFAGHADDKDISTALARVGDHCKELKVLGAYPHGELEE